MIDYRPSLKAATIWRGVSRAGEGYALVPNTLAADQPARDAAILNSLRACQVTLDTGQHVIHRECLGAPQSIVDSAHAPAWARIPTAPQLVTKRPKLGLPRWSLGAIKLSLPVTPPA